jgi:hypothetical protein
MTPQREMTRPGMAYCATHNRLFPHPLVGWLTPHGIARLALVPTRCDWCIKERGDEVVAYIFMGIALPVTAGEALTA